MFAFGKSANTRVLFPNNSQYNLKYLPKQTYIRGHNQTLFNSQYSTDHSSILQFNIIMRYYTGVSTINDLPIKMY